MKERTLKEVAQAGLVLGFEWIARDSDGDVFIFKSEPRDYGTELRIWSNDDHMLSLDDMDIEITDYEHPPEQSVLKLSEIVDV